VLVERPAPGSGLPATELVFCRPDFDSYVAVSEQAPPPHARGRGERTLERKRGHWRRK
jgi:hypothetical protein